MTVKTEIELENNIEKFISKPLKDKKDLLNFIEYYLLNFNHEIDYSKKVASNFVDITYSYYKKLPKIKKLYFLKAADNFFDTVLTMKIWQEQLLSTESAISYWKDTPLYFSGLGLMTKKLKDLKYNISLIEPKKTGDKFVLVEGESEFYFIKIIQFITNLYNFDFELSSYGGKYEHNNLIHLIKDKNKQGAQVYLSYDCDGKNYNISNKLKKRDAKVKKVFGFKYDFESSFPLEILARAVNLYIETYIKNKFEVNEKEIKKLIRKKIPFIKLFEKKYNIKINKVNLAFYLGQIISRHLNSNWNEIVNKKNKEKPLKYKHEIYKFINFLVKY